VTGASAFGARGVQSSAALASYLESEPPAGPGPFELDPLALLDPTRSRRFDRTAALATAVVERALDDAELRTPGTGLVMGNAFGSVERSIRFVQKAVTGGPRVASPAEFPHLVVSAASGNASIYLGLRGPVFAVSDRESGAESALSAAVSLLSAGQAKAFAAGAVEAFDTTVQAIHARLGLASGATERSEGAAFLIVEDEDAARARGARVLAKIDGPFALAVGSAGAELAPPETPERAMVVTAALSAEHRAFLERSPWGRCRRGSVLRASGRHEAAGGFALCAAASLLATGLWDEVLAVGGRASVLYCTLFSRAGKSVTS
jgi:3-oxoacyl-[acyl-carrier-protein] synthase II